MVLGRSAKTLDLRLQLGDTGLKLVNASLLQLSDFLLPQNGSYQVILRRLLKLLAGHTRYGHDSWFDDGCVCASQQSRQVRVR